jgi:F-type H+-transporting ATPase subunit epsilon
MTSLKTGILRYRDSSGTERFVFVSGGFAEALPNKVTVLAESAERRRDIDVERARSALERAQKRLAGKQEEIDYVRARAALERAMYRIRLVESRGRG